MVYSVWVTDIPIFVITDENGRQINLANLLNSHKLKFRVSPAVYFKKPPDFYNARVSYLLSRRRLSLRELGCAQAHQNVYNTIIQEDIDLALILEEDSIILDFDSLIKSIEIINNSNFRNGNGIIASFYSQNAELIRLQKTPSPWKRCHGFPSGAVAYLIDKKAAKVLISHNSNLNFAADWPPARVLTFFLNTETIVTHEDGFSAIDESRTLNNLSILVKTLNILDLLICTRFIRISQITDLRFGYYLTQLHLPVFLRMLRKISRFSYSHKL